MQKRCDRHGFFRFLIDHYGHARTAIRVTTAGELAPVVVGVVHVHEVSPVAESRHEGNREPVAFRFTKTGLILHVVCQMGKRVALRNSALVGDGFVAAGETDRLERQEADLLRIIERELDDPSHLLVIDAVYDCDHRNDLHAGTMQVVYSFKLYIK